jgi:hypothetical protein
MADQQETQRVTRRFACRFATQWRWKTMRFTRGQHSEMAERLDERASRNTDPAKAEKQAAMANTFRLLARRAAKQGAKSG